MKHFEAAYPADRATQLRYLIANNFINEVAVNLLDVFAKRYGCIARDLGIFPNGPSSLTLTWNVPIRDIRNGGRKRNTLIASIELYTTHISFRDGQSSDQTLAHWNSAIADGLIKAYRTYEKSGD